MSVTTRREWKRPPVPSGGEHRATIYSSATTVDFDADGSNHQVNCDATLEDTDSFVVGDGTLKIPTGLGGTYLITYASLWEFQSPAPTDGAAQTQLSVIAGSVGLYGFTNTGLGSITGIGGDVYPRYGTTQTSYPIALADGAVVALNLNAHMIVSSGGSPTNAARYYGSNGSAIFLPTFLTLLRIGS